MSCTAHQYLCIENIIFRWLAAGGRLVTKRICSIFNFKLASLLQQIMRCTIEMKSSFKSKAFITLWREQRMKYHCHYGSQANSKFAFTFIFTYTCFPHTAYTVYTCTLFPFMDMKDPFNNNIRISSLLQYCNRRLLFSSKFF